MPYLKVDRSHQHRLSNIDPEAKTGTCSICGQVRVRLHSKGRGATCWTKHLEYRRSQTAAPVSSESRWKSNLAVMGMTPESYKAMLDGQGGLCAICRRPPGKRRLSIDHDHGCCPANTSCGDCVRGLLCNHCNRGIGLLGDSPQLIERALEYLRA